MNKKNWLCKGALLLSLLGLKTNLNAQCAKFEPPVGKAILIIGQDLDAVGGLTDYTNGYVEKVIASDNTVFPAGVTTYTDIDYNLGLWNKTNYGAGDLRAQAYPENQKFNNSVISIGVDLQSGQLAAVANGQRDGQIANLINWVNQQNPRPVFLRIGYEFNATHNGYNGATFITAWKRFVDKFRAANVSNVAFVWQADDSQMSEANLAAWYPGDSYVDWVGFSRFLGNGGGMISFARNHKKPCMIAEATPQGHHTGTEDGTTLWNQWYAPLFQLIHNNNDVIKALCYINQNWDAQPIWQGTFGDSRIQMNAVLKTKWLTEIKDPMWLHGSSTLFTSLYTGCSGGVNADFIANSTRIYSGQSTTFSNRSSGNITTYSWDFGADASPATSTSSGPVKVTYSTPGLKTVKLTVSGAGKSDTRTKTDYIWVEPVPSTGCMMLEDFNTTASVSSFAGAPNAFTHKQVGSSWVITSKGYGEWDTWVYKFNDGTAQKKFNFSHPTLTKPRVTLKVRKKPSGASNNLALLKVDMYDVVSATDGSFSNTIALTETFQTITIDFTGKFINKYGCGFAGCGALDSTNIIGLQFSVNPGYSTYPITYNGTKYSSYYAGDIEIDVISVGNGCDNVILSDFSADKFSVELNQSITYTSSSTGTISSYSWNFGEGASPATAVGAGPHTVSYSTYGLKTVSLTVTGPAGSDTKTRTDYVNVAAKTANCGAFSDLFKDGKVSKFVVSQANGVFTFSETNDIMTITSGGHGDWDHIEILTNDGAIATPVDFSSKQKLYMKVKASASVGLRISLMDANGVEIGNNSIQPAFDQEVSTSWKDIAIDYTGKLGGDWFQQGSVDPAKISKIVIRPNPGWNTPYPLGTHTSAFKGTIDIDYVVLGDTTGCFSNVITSMVSVNESGKVTVMPNPFNTETRINIDGVNTGNIRIVAKDITGREVYNEVKGIEDGSVYFGKSLDQGVYIIQLLYNNKVKSFKLIKTN